MDVLIPDWSEQDDDHGYEVRTALVTSAKVGQSMSTVLDVAYGRGGTRPALRRTRHRGPRVAVR